MADIITIATRRISGTGLILPSLEQLKYRRYTLFADIIRKPKTPYLNRDSEPPQTYYGVISMMKGTHILQTYKIEYDAQVWNFDADISGQALIAIKCQYLGVLQTFVNLGSALTLIPISVENTIGDYKNLPLQWDSIIIKCFADCAIQFVLKALPYDYCTESYKDPANSAQIPALPAPVEAGVGTDISPAYPDDSVTSPAQIDVDYVPAPTGNDCQTYSVVVQWLNTLNQPVQELKPFLGPIGRVRKVTSGGSASLEIECRGNAGRPCEAFRWVTFTSGYTANDLNSPSIVAIG